MPKMLKLFVTDFLMSGSETPARMLVAFSRIQKVLFGSGPRLALTGLCYQ